MNEMIAIDKRQPNWISLPCRILIFKMSFQQVFSARFRSLPFTSARHSAISFAEQHTHAIGFDAKTKVLFINKPHGTAEPSLSIWRAEVGSLEEIELCVACAPHTFPKLCYFSPLQLEPLAFRAKLQFSYGISLSCLIHLTHMHNVRCWQYVCACVHGSFRSGFCVEQRKW